MLQFCTLYSGSTGNCSLVQTQNQKILIDAGESAKKITDALASLSIGPEATSGILVTHEHSDHLKGRGTFSKKFHIPVFANKETWNAMPTQLEKVEKENQKEFSFDYFSIGDITILPFSIPHDAANPCGFNLYYQGKKMSIATDIGHMNDSIIHHLSDSSFVLLEANYEPEILKCSSYPYLLKQRIAGPNGHLSNEAAGKTISYLLNHGLKNVMLGHLSKENNFPELAYKSVVEQILENHREETSYQLSVASRYTPSPVVSVG